jgi:hypothetical protein
MSALTDFMKKLGQDAKLLEAYKQDPRAVMRANGLSDEEIEAVMAGDEAKLKKLTGDESYQEIIHVTSGND